MSVSQKFQPGSREWLDARRGGVGGSDSAAVVGLSPWRTPLEVYLDKIGELVTEENADMRRGSLLEPVVRQLYCDETGRAVLTPNEILRNPDYPFALANLDGIASGEILLECKTSRSRIGWGDPGTAEIPVYYLCQVQHCMMVSRLRRADVAVLFGDFEFGIYPIEADQEFQDLLAEQEATFWRCVQKRIPPDPITHSDLKRRWPRSVVAAATATADDLRVARVLSVVKDCLTTLEDIKDEAEAFLKAHIRDAEGLRLGAEVICTWKTAKGAAKFDTDRFKADHPDLFDQYLTEPVGSRRFLLKRDLKCLDQTQTDTILPRIPENLLPSHPEATG